MSEWMTTGEMIDRLKVGEVAEQKQDGWRVTRKNGLVFIDKDGDIDKNKGDKGHMILVNGYVIGSKWRILPKYVSFEEAMKALKDGLIVRAHDGTGGYYEFDGKETFTQLAKEYPVIRIYELMDMKWTIAE